MRQHYVRRHHERTFNPVDGNKGPMLPFPMFSVVGVRADGHRRILATDLTPYRQAVELRQSMLSGSDHSGYHTIVVESEPPHREVQPAPRIRPWPDEEPQEAFP